MKLIIDIDNNEYELINKTRVTYDWHTVFHGKEKDKEMTLAIFDLVKALKNGIPYEEKPKSEWTIDEEWDVLGKCKVTIYTCPFCGKVEYEPFDYCRCGADMRKEKEDEDSN